MPIKEPQYRHLVENFENKVQVTIPSRNNILYFVWFAVWLLVWGYVTSRLFLLWEIVIRGAIEMNGSGVVTMLMICLTPFLLASLGMIAFAIHTALWQMSGKEIIEVNDQGLRVTKQVLRWKWSKVYASDEIRDLRTNTQKLSIFFPRRRVRRFIGGLGMVTFSLGRRNPSFGLDISEEEAEQIILTLKKRLPE